MLYNTNGSVRSDPIFSVRMVRKLKKAGVAGLGLIGGSVALTLKKQGFYVVGSETDGEVSRYALDRGVVDEIGGTESFRGCEVVFVCVPVKHVAEVCREALAVTDGGAVVTDVASVKCITEDLGGRFIGGHPMAGTEKSGIAAARSHLFENAYYVLVKGKQASEDDLRYMTDLVGAMKARPVVMTAAEHDRRVSKVSHLPHLAAYALSELALKVDGFTGTGFMDTTRIAASDPEFWTDVTMLNRKNILADLDEYVAMLKGMRAAIAEGDREGLRSTLASAQSKREALQYKRVYLSEYCLDLDLKDEVGAAARVTELLASNGINISGLQIINSREGVGGALRISITAESDYERALALLGLKDKR